MIGPVIEPSIYHVWWKTMALTCKYRTLKTPRRIAGSFEIVTIPKTRVHQLQTNLSRGRPPAQALTSESNENEHDAAQSIPTDAPITWTIVQNPNTLDVWVEWSKYLQACVTGHRTVHQTSHYYVLESLTQMTTKQRYGELASWVRYDRTTPLWQISLEEM